MLINSFVRGSAYLISRSLLRSPGRCKINSYLVPFNGRNRFASDLQIFSLRRSLRTSVSNLTLDNEPPHSVNKAGRQTSRLDRAKEWVEERSKNENIATVPNLLCVTRIILSPFLGYLVIHQSFDWALGLFVVAGVTDMLDGFIARNFKNQLSVLGSFLDPLADKLLISVLFVTLTIADLIPIYLTTMIIIRDVLLMGAAFYIKYISLPPPKTLARYFDIRHATAKLKPTFISKVNTVIQLSLVGFTLAAPSFQFVDHPYLETLWYVTAVSTVCSGASYLFSKNTFKLLKEDAAQKLRRK